MRVQYLRAFLFLLGTGLSGEVSAQNEEMTQPRSSLAGEQSFQELKRAVTNQDYNLHYGRIGFGTEASVAAIASFAVPLLEGPPQGRRVARAGTDGRKEIL